MQGLLSPKKHVLLNEFDKVKRDYSAHEEEIHLKFVDILKERVLLHCNVSAVLQL
jgi:vacuolar protein sorting-associated protein 54